MNRRHAILLIRRRIGRRGAFLIFLAFLDFVYGYYLVYPPPQAPAITRYFPVLPAEFWGGWWIATGVLCIAGAFMRSDRIAYGMAATIKAAWGLRYIYLWYLHAPLAWVSATIWMIFAGVILVIAGWPEEIVNLPDLPERAGDRDR